MPRKKNDTCEKYGLAITDYVLDESMDISKAELISHLQSCRRCREDLEDWENTYAALRTKEYCSRPEVKTKMEAFIKELTTQPIPTKGMDLDINTEVSKPTGVTKDARVRNGKIRINFLPNEVMQDIARAVEEYRKHIMPYSNMIQDSVRTSRFLSSVTIPQVTLDAFSDLGKYNKELGDFIKEKSVLGETIKGLSENYKILSPLIKSMPAEALKPLQAIKLQSLSVASDINALRLLPEQMPNAFRAIKQLGDFIQLTLTRIKKEVKDSGLISSLYLSSNLAISQNWHTINSFNQFAKIAIQADVQPASYVPTLGLFRFQQNEIEKAGLIQGVDENEICKESLAARINKATRITLSMINDCNKHAFVGMDKEASVFKPTNKLLEIFLQLPLLIATKQSEFADFCEGLYLLLYEGAGKDRLRFLKENGGVLERTECDIIWDIKQLRLFYRHDIEHGSKSDVDKKRVDIASSFSNIIGKLPQKQEDYLQAQLAMLKKANDFLNNLFQKTIGKKR